MMSLESKNSLADGVPIGTELSNGVIEGFVQEAYFGAGNTNKRKRTNVP